jgi:L-malate glycosyltransferase
MKHPSHKVPKVLHVVLSMEVGGAERLVYDLVRVPELSDSPPVVCCLDRIGELGANLQGEGFSVYCKGRRSGIDMSVIPWLKQIIDAERVDVVHAHQYTPLFYSVPAASWARVRLIYTEHGRFFPDRKSWKRTICNPLLALGVDHLVSISTATARAMSEFDNLPKGRIKVIHNGVDFDRMRPAFDREAKRRELGLEHSGPVLGTASRLNPIKNIPLMFRIFKRVLRQYPGATLVIAGDGPELGPLEELAASLAIADHVRFIGLRFDLPEVYPLFDVFLLTSFTEGISVTLLEAMACGVAAVVTDVGGNCEVVVEGETGYRVEIDQEDVLAQRVLYLLDHPEQARRFGDCARERVLTDFSFPKMFGAYLQLYGQGR